MDAIHDHCWLILVSWYKSITVQIKHKRELNNPIKVCKGTRQGGLSPFLFNLFYQEMTESLAECTSYNLFVYADDILLTSLTATGLQTMISVADKYITDHGLRFNPSKTECKIFGKCHLDPPPEWRLGGTHLVQTNSVNYLGVTLSHCKPHEHVDKRIIACRRAYFALQGAGFNNKTLMPSAIYGRRRYVLS